MFRLFVREFVLFTMKCSNKGEESPVFTQLSLLEDERQNDQDDEE